MPGAGPCGDRPATRSPAASSPSSPPSSFTKWRLLDHKTGSARRVFRTGARCRCIRDHRRLRRGSGYPDDDAGESDPGRDEEPDLHGMFEDTNGEAEAFHDPDPWREAERVPTTSGGKGRTGGGSGRPPGRWSQGPPPQDGGRAIRPGSTPLSEGGAREVPGEWDAATYDRIADPMTRWGSEVLGRTSSSREPRPSSTLGLWQRSGDRDVVPAPADRPCARRSTPPCRCSGQASRRFARFGESVRFIES